MTLREKIAHLEGQLAVARQTHNGLPQVGDAIMYRVNNRYLFGNITGMTDWSGKNRYMARKFGRTKGGNRYASFKIERDRFVLLENVKYVFIVCDWLEEKGYLEAATAAREYFISKTGAEQP